MYGTVIPPITSCQRCGAALNDDFVCPDWRVHVDEQAASTIADMRPFYAEKRSQPRL